MPVAYNGGQGERAWGEITGVGAQTGGLGSPMRPDHPDCNFYPPMNPPMGSLRRSGGITKAALQLPPLNNALESRILECSHPHVYTFTVDVGNIKIKGGNFLLAVLVARHGIVWIPTTHCV